MGSAVSWVWFGVSLYWLYCIFMGLKGLGGTKTASDYFIAGRQLPMWVFVLAATATSFSGWTFIGHPATLFKSGLAYAFASFYAITIPFSGVLFLKRQWLVGKRYDFITPGEMFRHYYDSEAMRLLTVLVALVFSVPYLAVQLKACGLLFNKLTGLPVYAGAILLSIVVVFYVAAGGLKSVAWVDCLQCLLLIVGIVVVGISTIVAIGGWDAFTASVRGLEAKYLEVPGIIKFKASGPEWTGLKTLTYMFALMGIQAAPAFSMWAFANKSARPFRWQQVIASSLVVGAVMIFFTAFQGLGGQVLHQAGNLDLPSKADGSLATDALVPTLMLKTLPTPLLVFAAIAALAAMQSTGAAYMSTGGGMITRDLFVRYLRPNATDAEQIWFGRGCVVLITVLAFMVAFISGDQLVLLGGLAVSYGFQMYPALIGSLFWRRLTRQGIVAGLVAGLIGVSVTYMIQGFRYPLTIHSAGWGILLNMTIAVLVSYLGPARTGDELVRADEFHNYLRDTAAVPPEKRRLKMLMWVLTPLWFVFAIGPGIVLGNHAFPPVFGLPSLWVWQIVWWLAGVGMMYVLAFRLEMSTPPRVPLGDEDSTVLLSRAGEE
ncbi:sodium:solute symporter [Candidatus Poribacteria bacterium]|nr:sodium:solute symporter [Candidatus Poribacteria bacterium]